MTSAMDAVKDAFRAQQALSKQWYDKEREGIALIEQFQTALVASRSMAAAKTTQEETNGGVLKTFVESSERRSAMDPWVLEDLFAQISELKAVFDQLLHGMYTEYQTARQHVAEASSEEEKGVSASEYVQFLAQDTASFEAEYQHVEALLAMLTFKITTDQLRTLVISWSTSPFLEPERSKAFRQRHEQACAK
ncbi:hypothetical protein Poli38472_001585 [Pythium oligandrum]|uniref:Uncharacterized protein n=1 Tax=Pythium oligandrum TaxID=41045 RepID=A0A8K1CTU0_PYTOL|nr:hypothetical protein Poli38472_001585 [Pythium oligandrum]|eukprot:TMW69429.1 hypothetical protein Poli38472_001585 [Pythium oligandrum]